MDRSATKKFSDKLVNGTITDDEFAMLRDDLQDHIMGILSNPLWEPILHGWGGARKFEATSVMQQLLGSLQLVSPRRPVEDMPQMPPPPPPVPADVS